MKQRRRPLMRAGRTCLTALPCATLRAGLTLLSCLATASASAQPFTPALDPARGGQSARVLLETLGSWARQPGALDDAAALTALRRLRPLLRSDVALILGERDGVVETLPGVVREWPASWQRRLAGLEDAESMDEWWRSRGTTTDPTALVRLAGRWGPSRAAGEALAEAAWRLYLRGDAVGAAELARRARGLGVEAAVPESRAGPPPSQTPLLVSYWWFDKMPDRLGGIRSVPVATGGQSWVLVSATHAIHLGRNGVLWGYPEVPVARGPVPRWPGRLEFPVYGGAASMGVVVVRQGGAATGGGVLRALRVSDGGLLWSSDSDTLAGGAAGWHIASLPAVSGRYVYVLASETRAATAYSVSLLALELTTGRVLWRTRLGELPEVALAGRVWERGEAPGASRSPGLWDDAWSPLVVGDRVYVALGGAVYGLDRFDGMLLGAGRYPASAAVAREGGGPAEAAMSRWGPTLVVSEGGDGRKRVIVAPRDADGVFAFDAGTLAPLWRQPRLGAYGLVGVAAAGGEDGVVLQGSELMLLDARTGERKWQTAPRTQTRWTGPAVLVPEAEMLVVPTSVGPGTMTTRTGQWLPGVPESLADLRPMMTGATAEVLAAADVLRAFVSAGSAEELLPPRTGGSGPQRIVPAPSQPPRQTPRGPLPPPRVEPQRSGG